jgi:hypothetical protein
MARKQVLNIEKYAVCNIEEIDTTTYIRKQDILGNWLIIKIEEGSVLSISYATQKNNPTITSYDLAWTNKTTTLIYGGYPNII